VELSNNITEIPARTFNKCESLEQTSIPAGVKSIGDYAYGDCKSLPSPEFPLGLKDIGYGAYSGCVSVEVLKLPNSVEKIDGAFSYMYGLKEAYLPESLTSVGSSTFFHSYNLEKVEMTNNIKSIGESAFHGCSSLKDIALPDSITDIGTGAFFRCSSLKSITIPESVTTVPRDLCGHCTSLEQVNLSHKTEAIASGAFEGCKSLQSLEITEGTTKIGTRAFADSGLKSCEIPNSVEKLGREILAGTEVEKVSVPFVGSSKEDPKSTHFGYLFGKDDQWMPKDLVPKSLQTIEITDARNIGDNGFTGLGVKKVSINEGVEHIGLKAFDGCDSLRYVERGTNHFAVPEQYTSSQVANWLNEGYKTYEGDVHKLSDLINKNDAYLITVYQSNYVESTYQRVEHFNSEIQGTIIWDKPEIGVSLNGLKFSKIETVVGDAAMAQEVKDAGVKFVNIEEYSKNIKADMSREENNSHEKQSEHKHDHNHDADEGFSV
jgi:hypothetical protein